MVSCCPLAITDPALRAMFAAHNDASFRAAVSQAWQGATTQTASDSIEQGIHHACSCRNHPHTPSLSQATSRTRPKSHRPPSPPPPYDSCLCSNSQVPSIVPSSAITKPRVVGLQLPTVHEHVVYIRGLREFLTSHKCLPP